MEKSHNQHKQNATYTCSTSKNYIIVISYARYTIIPLHISAGTRTLFKINKLINNTIGQS